MKVNMVRNAHRFLSVIDSMIRLLQVYKILRTGLLVHMRLDSLASSPLVG